MNYRGCALGIAGAVAVAVGVGCYGPTEVRIEISTDRPCLAPASAEDLEPTTVKTAIAVGGSALDAAQVTEVSSCLERPGADTEIGSLVVVPSGARDARVSVQVTMTTNGRPTSDCVPTEGANETQVLPGFCIVARRSFAFIRHTSRVLPIKLYDACRGVRCAADQTCGKGGGCRSSDVDVEPEPGETCVGSCDDAGAPLDAAPDGALPDAAPPACTGVNGDHVVAAVANGSEKLVGNTTRLFWDAPSANSPPVYEVRTVSKSGGPVETIAPAPYAGLSSEITALAADDENLWIATPTSVTRYHLSSKTPITQPVGAIASIATHRTANPTATYFATRRKDPNTAGLLWVADTPTSPLRAVDGTFGGEHVAVGGTHAYVFDGVSPKIYRYLLPLPPAGGINPPSFMTVGDVAASAATAYDASAYFVTVDKANEGRKLHAITDGPLPTTQPLATLARPGRIAADASFVYYLDHGSPDTKPTTLGAVRRVGSMLGPIIPVITPPVAEGFDDVHGLVVDECVYFFAMTNQTASLRVYPKDPTKKNP